MERERFAEAEEGFRRYQTAYPDEVESYWNLAQLKTLEAPPGRSSDP